MCVIQCLRGYVCKEIECVKDSVCVIVCVCLCLKRCVHGVRILLEKRNRILIGSVSEFMDVCGCA